MNTTGVTMEQTPKPLLEVIDLDSSKNLSSQRKRRMKNIFKSITTKESKDVVTKYRRRQKRLLDGYESDPDPYYRTYVFYCLEIPIDI
jgi:signal recognition particle GTPase